MITKEHYEMLTDSIKKGANPTPIDFEDIKEYELTKKKILNLKLASWIKWKDDI